MRSRSTDEEPLSLLQQELAPYPGRLAGSLRNTLAIVLALVIAMTLRVSGMSLALALLFLMQRERPGLTLRVGLQILAGTTVACFGSIVWVQLADGTEVARFLGVVLCIFISAFCMAATTMPLFWTIVGFYGFVDLAAWDAHNSPNTIVTTSLYNVASIGLVVLCAAAVEHLFGTRHPGEDLMIEMQKRLTSLQRFFSALADAEPGEGSGELRVHHSGLIQYAHAGDLYLNELYDRLRDSSPNPEQVPLGIHYRIGLLARVLEKTVVFGFHLPSGQADHRASYRKIAAICGDLASSRQPAEVNSLPETEPEPLREIYLALQQYGGTQKSAAEPAVQNPATHVLPKRFEFFLPGVFDSGDAVFYALKLTLAATVCYIIYSAVAWPAILTCVVTVLFTGLSSTGAMKQKQIYRFSGAAIGGIIGILTVSLLYPNMDSITALVLVAASVTLLSAWVMRSPRMSYVGVQICFAFFLTALQGFSATTRIAPARDRVFGVGLGILVMWFVFDQIWPTRTSDALQSSLTRVRSALTKLQQISKNPDLPENIYAFRRLRTGISQELVNVQQLDFAARFEVGRHRKREMAKSRRLLHEIESLSAEFYAKALQISAS